MTSPSMTVEPLPNVQLNPLPVFGPLQQSTSDTQPGNISAPMVSFPFSTTNGFPYSITSTEPLQLALQPNLVAIPDNPSQSSQADAFYPTMENAEQPIFDLNDLQNFFEWENGENAPQLTGLEGLGPLGWSNLANT